MLRQAFLRKLTRIASRLVRAGALLTAVAACGACVSNAGRVERLAQRAGLTQLEISGLDFRLTAFERLAARSTHLVLFIEGDGSPWVAGGWQVAADPTPRNPLMLRIAARTTGSVLYLGRPCYFGHARDSGCRPALWTSGRYSQEVVSSMVAAINGYLERHRFGRVTLVGHSGGGTLAVLVAPRLAVPVDVLTMAASLDIDAWTRLHGYAALFDSLNPSDQAPLAAGIGQFHLYGGRDKDVPAAVASRYLQRLDPKQVRIVPDFDHVCCWERDWVALWKESQSALAAHVRQFVHRMPPVQTDKEWLLFSMLGPATGGSLGQLNVSVTAQTSPRFGALYRERY